MPLGDIALGQVDAEQHRGLLVEHRFGGVDVLGGDLVVIENAPRTEAHRLSTGTANGPEQPPVEAVHRAASAFPGQSGGLKFLELEALSDHVFGQRVPPRWREATAELSRGGGIEIAFGQVRAGRSGLVRFERGRIELLRGGIGGDQTAAAAAVALHAGAATGVADRVSDPIGQEFDCLDEADMLHLLHEGIDVTALPAAEAVEMTMVGADVKRRRLLVVERAEALE